MSKYRLTLTPEEEVLLGQIDLSPTHLNHDEGRRAFLANQEPILALIASLEGRGGIPEHWTRYWTDPDYNPGRIKASREGLFERNNRHGDDILTHPNFIKHLRYLILGPELPESVQRVFEQEVGDPRWLSSGDALDLGPRLRKMVRDAGLSGHEAAPEFFKLALSTGLDLDPALIIMRVVQQLR